MMAMNSSYSITYSPLPLCESVLELNMEMLDDVCGDGSAYMS